MNFYKKQDGYTLLITLILIVLLFLVTASFTVTAMNQTKQIKRTDYSFTATSLAEMGVELLTKSHQDIIFDNRKYMIDEINDLDKNVAHITYKTNIDLIMKKYYKKTVSDIVSLHTTFEKSIDPNHSYKSAMKGMSNTEKLSTISEIERTGLLNDSVFGVIDQDNFQIKKSIDLGVTIPPNLGVHVSVTENTSSQIITTVTYAGDIACTNCSTTPYNGGNGNSAKLTADLLRNAPITFGQLSARHGNNTGDIDNKKVVSTQTITFSGNQAYLYDSRIYAKNINFSNGSKSHHNYFQNSKVYTQTLEKTGEINKLIYLSSSSKICIAQYTTNLEAILAPSRVVIDGTSAIYVYAPNKEGTRSGNVFYVGKQQFQSQCNATITETPATSTNNVVTSSSNVTTVTQIDYK